MEVCACIDIGAPAIAFGNASRMQLSVEDMNMDKLIVKTSTEREFFRRGKVLAKLADSAKQLPKERILSFEEPSELLALLSAARLELLRAVREQPASITVIAVRLGRDRSAVKRDIDRLVEAGLVRIETKVHPGHGQMKEVRATASRFRLEAILA